MQTLTSTQRESVGKVLALSLEAVINNDYNYQTIKAINACANKLKCNFKHNLKTTKYVLISNINLMLKKVC